MSETLHGRLGTCQGAHDGLRPFSGTQGGDSVTPPAQRALSEAVGEGCVSGAAHGADDDLAQALAALKAKSGTSNPFNRPSIVPSSSAATDAKRGAAPPARTPSTVTQALDPEALLRPPAAPEPERPLSAAIEALRVIKSTSAPSLSQRRPSDVVDYSYAHRPPPLADGGATAGPSIRAREDADQRRRRQSDSDCPALSEATAGERAEQHESRAASERAQDVVDPVAAATLQTASVDPNDPDAWREELQATTARRQRRLSRSESKISAAILREDGYAIAAQEREVFKYDWATADDIGRSPEELASIDQRRAELAERIVQADGSALTTLSSVFSAEELKTARFMVRDDVAGIYTACEWGKLWREDQLAGNAALHACWGVREDSSAVRGWTSQRARAIFVCAWIAWRVRRAGRSVLRDHGFLLAQGVPLSLLQVLCAPYGKETLHRNAISGVHRSGSVHNPDLGYIRALENSHFFEAVQHGDRKAAPRQCNTYRVRVTVAEETLAPNERALRTMVRNWWRSLAEVGEIVVCRARRMVIDAQLHAAIRGELLAAPS